MEAQPAQPLTEQQKAEKDFADLLSSLMECVEKYQEGEAGEGNYLIAMNALRDIHKFKDKLKGNVVYHHYEAVARQPAQPPARPPAQRKKLTDEGKRQAGYKTCPTCGCLFADNSKLKRHMNTTEKCRHIRIEKEVALNTKQIYRDEIYRPVNQALASTPTSVVIPKPDNECLTKDHPYRPQFITEFLLCFSHREEYLHSFKSGDTPMTKEVGFLRPQFQGTPLTNLAPDVITHMIWNPSASFLRRDPANAIVSLSNFLTPPSLRHFIGWVECNEAEKKWSFKVEVHQYDRTLKKSNCVQATRFNYITHPPLAGGIEMPFMPLTEKDLFRLSTTNRSNGRRVIPDYAFFVPFDYYAPWMIECWEEFGLLLENWEMIRNA